MLTGGTDNDGSPLTRVTSYNIHENAVVDLPELREARMQHGCTHYLNNDNQKVSKCAVGVFVNFPLQVFLVSGGYSQNQAKKGRFLDSTEMFIEGQSDWSKVNGLTLPSHRRGPFMITLNNNVFLTGMINILERFLHIMVFFRWRSYR